MTPSTELTSRTTWAHGVPGGTASSATPPASASLTGRSAPVPLITSAAAPDAAIARSSLPVSWALATPTPRTTSPEVSPPSWSR